MERTQTKYTSPSKSVPRVRPDRCERHAKTSASWSTQSDERTRAGAPSDDVQKIREGVFATGGRTGLAVEAKRLAVPAPAATQLQAAFTCGEQQRRGGAAVEQQLVAAHRAQRREAGGDVCCGQCGAASHRELRAVPAHRPVARRQVERAFGLERVPRRTEAAQQRRRPT